MSGLIRTYYDQAQLADAAYAELFVGMPLPDYIQELKERGFASLEAAEFANRYSIVSTFNDVTTGFAATLFQRIGTNEKVLAIRGTNDVVDLLLSDLQIGLFGLADQYVSLKNFYLQLTTEGKLLPTDNLTITGHSLGGYLAQAFTVDHPLNVSHTYTYNAPGFGGVLVNPFGSLGVAGASIDNHLITNLIAEGPSFVSSQGRQLGEVEHAFIETSLNPLTNHSARSLVDALALYDVFARIDPSLSVSSVTTILNAASATAVNSLENGLDALRKVVLGPNQTTTPVGDRDAYYTNLFAFRDNLPSVSSYRLDSLAGVSNSMVYSQAKASTADGLAYRYALKELNPFVVRGVDYQAMHSQDGSLDLYDTVTGQGAWTLNALSDRAELLAKRLAVNINDGDTVPTDTHYVDKQTGLELGSVASANEVIFGDAQDNRDLTGHAGGDHLYGGAGDDLLIGQGGQDYLEGNAGSDELYGGSENDILLGQQGDDQLFGEAENDRLNGGLGDDRLDGGTGLDTYFYHSGQGLDRIVDADRIGTIVFDGQTLVGGIRRQGDPIDTYRSPDGQVTFVKSGANLVINNALIIESFDFANGALGIKLADVGNLVDSAGPTINYNNGEATIRYDGDATDNQPIFTAAANHEAYGYGGNDILNFESGSMLFHHQIFGGDGHDELRGGNGHDRVFGGSGRDLVLGGFGGDDVLDGGDDIDLLKGGTGQDALSGGLGDDGLDGGSGDDVLFGQDGNDLLSGESLALGATTTGNDYLDGGAGADWLMGMLGEDVLVGGTENDRLYGDQAPATAPNFELAYPGVVTPQSGMAFDSVTGGADYLDGGEGDDYLQGDAGGDVLLGGAGVDVLAGDDLQLGVIQEGKDWLDGGLGDDELIGGGGEDALFGGDGDDFLVGDYLNNLTQGFDDTLDGGAGSDELQGGGGHDLLDGGSEQDRLFGDAGDDSLYGGTGNDQLAGGDGADALVGEEGADLLFGEAGDDWLFGEDGDDQLDGGIGTDELDGGTGNDLLFGQDGNDRLFGNAGDDELQGNLGDDLLVGDTGNDRLFGQEGNDTLFGEDGQDTLVGGLDRDVLTGGTGNDTLYGDEDEDQLFGDEGADTLDGGAGADRLEGGAGNDAVLGGDGADRYRFNLGDGEDQVFDVSGGNVIEFGSGITIDLLRLGQDRQGSFLIVGTPDDRIRHNGNAFDQAVFADGTTIAWTALLAQLQTKGVLTLGGPGNEEMIGSDLADEMQAGDGHDQLSGLAGDDILRAESGNDTLYGGLGHDRLEGGEGNDSLRGEDGDDLLIGGRGEDFLDGGPGHDTYLHMQGDGRDVIADTAVAGAGNVLRFGPGISSQSVRLGVDGSNLTVQTGVPGEDIVLANARRTNPTGAHDIETFQFADGTTLTYAELVARGFTLVGTSGSDNLFGTALPDRLQGGAGDDQLVGMAGHDQYVFNLGDGIDTITDSTTAGEGNEMVFGPGITPGMLRLGFLRNDSILTIRVGTGGDELRLSGFNPDDVFGLHAVETFRFSDGTVLSYNQLIARGFEVAGTPGADTLAGTNGADRMVGGAENDVLQGKDGDDVYVFNRGDGWDRVLDRAGMADAIHFGTDVLPSDVAVRRQGRDLVLSINGTTDRLTLSEFFLASTFQIEQVHFADGTVWDTADLEAATQTRLAGTVADDVVVGGTGVDILTGLSGNDELRGLDGDDVLDGGTGDDRLIGGTGDDQYLVDAPGDTIVELPGEGIDSVFSAVSHALAPNLERLTLTGTGAVDGTGNDLDNVLIGNAAANVLAGGQGNDTYLIGEGDTVVELPGAGTDTVQTTATATLGAHIENLVLCGTGSINGTGNELDNVLSGNGSVNILAGRAGNDTYIVKGFEQIVEEAGQGIDTVESARTYRLGANLENLVLRDSDLSLLEIQGVESPTVDGFGNGLDNTLVGNRGVNRLDGGAGMDTLIGGAGDDLYVVDHSGDVVIERIAEGYDTVESSASFQLSDHLERLVLTGIADIAGLGNGLDNILIGNSGANLMDGGGGNDLLDGGSGNDTYRFGIGSGLDQISDFTGSETIQLGDGIAPGDIRVLSNSNEILAIPNNLVLAIGSTGDKLRVVGYFDQAAPPIVRFQDGTTWEKTTVVGLWKAAFSPFDTTDWRHLTQRREAPASIVGTSGDETLIGTAVPDRFVSAVGADTLIGGTGDDVYRIDSVGDDTVVEQPGEGFDTVTGDVPSVYTLPTHVEALRAASSNFQLIGNELDNVLVENGGASTIDGGAGNDVLVGGYVRASSVAFDESQSDMLIGGAGDDILAPIGGTVRFMSGQEAILPVSNPSSILADDVLVGGAGDDTYVIYNSGEIIAEQTDGGIDTVRSSVSYELPDHVENLQLTTWGLPPGDGPAMTGTGNALDNLLIGSRNADVLSGGAGDDTLAGGSLRPSLSINEALAESMSDDGVNDLLIGGTGNDTYAVMGLASDTGLPDTIVEAAGEGIDTVASAVSYVLGDHLENLTLIGEGPSTGTGNALNNVLVGNQAANVLAGKQGNDRMLGGAGHDTYLFNAGDGIDTIDDRAVPGDGNVIQFGAGISRADLTLVQSSGLLTIQIGTNGDALRLVNFDPNDLNGSLVVETLAFADGTTVRVADLLGPRATDSDDLLEGGLADDEIEALDGNDVVDAGAGNDRIAGGTGNDTLTGGPGDDTYLFNLGDGVDTITDQALPGEGNSLQFGAGITPADLSLGLGSLVIRVGAGGDAIHLTSFDPADVFGPRAIETFRFADGTVLTYQDLLARGFDFVGTANDDALTGTDTTDRLMGLAGNDNMQSGGGDDLLDGGVGADRMAGGVGHDTYSVDDPGDVVTEMAGEGLDTVQSLVSYSLGANVENLTLAGTADLTGTGNELDNLLVGNSGRNRLTGGTGNDTYVVGMGDTVIESAGGGIDTIQTNVTWTLGSNLENLTLTGTGNINGHGNSLNNLIIGNAGMNWLDGGSGQDRLEGGEGHDLLLGGSGHDQLLGGLGNDALTAGSGHDLLDGGDGTDMLDGGSGDDQLSGGADDDLLLAGSGADQLAGGTGNDLLIGGSGHDDYLFARGDGQDRLIEDGGSGQDTVRFGATIDPLDLVLSRQADDLRIALYGTSDQITIHNWYDGTSNQTELIVAGNGQQLLNNQVDQLIQAMAGFTSQTGLSWEAAVAQRPEDVQAILAASWS
ncbi:MAG: calcium-binding protein [Nitrospiraceae bacterium]